MTLLVVDARLAEGSGIGAYLRHLVPRIARQRPRWTLRVLVRGQGRIADWSGGLGNIETETWHLPPLSASDLLGPGPVRLAGASAYWVPHFNVPWVCAVPLVVTLHDALPFAAALAYGGFAKSALARALIRRAARRAKLVLCPSQFTLDALVRHAGLEASKARVTPLAALRPDSAGSAIADPERPYVVFVGNFKRHKNLAALVAAFAAIADRVPHDLRIIGSEAGMRDIDKNALAAAGALGERVHIERGLSDADVWRRIERASVLVLPSLHEGFGLPIVEAMAAGCPVIASHAGALREVAADAALYFDPASTRELAARIEEVLGSEFLARDLRARGLKRAAEFSWDTTARQTVMALEEKVG